MAFQDVVNTLSPRRAPSVRRESNGDCSSGVEPRIVIPVVAGSNPVSHPIFLSALRGVRNFGCVSFFPLVEKSARFAAQSD